MYATEERWIRQAIPEDAVVSVSGSDRFPQIANIPVTALPSISDIAPASSRLSYDSRSINWLAQPEQQSSIQLKLNLPETTRSGKEFRRVVCVVNDDGEFTLPQELYTQLAGQRPLTFSLVRFRSGSYSQDAATLRIVQSSYPAFQKPN